MAFYDDQKFILSHIRHSFITCDDTGMCEMVMLNESMQNHYIDDPDSHFLKSLEVETKSELLEAAQSYDIMSDMELIGVRRRSNTAQRLERLKKERKSQSKVKVIQWRDNPYLLTEPELHELFPKKEITPNIKKPIAGKPIKSALSLQLENCPAIPNNPFNEYARFDGRVSEGAPTKRIVIYLTMLPMESRQYPMEVVTLCTAKVHDLIGLICWQYINEGKEPRLKPNVSHYSLRIAEENGEVDPDFPSLNSKELVAKFGFPVLALVEKDDLENGLVVTIHIDDVFSKIQVNSLQITLQEVLELTMKKRRPSLVKGVCYKLEKRSEPGISLDLKMSLAECNTLEFVLVSDQGLGETSENRTTNSWNLDMFEMEAPLYQSYTVIALKLGRSADVEMGINGVKIEITPLPPKGNTKLFQWQPKAATVNIEDVLSVEILSHKLTTGKSSFKISYYNGADIKTWTFEAETKTTNEIVRKLEFVMQMRTSTVRNEYLEKKGQKNRRKVSYF